MLCILEPLYCGHHWALIREVSLFQRLICTQKYTFGTSETVLIREVFLFQRLICTQEYTIGTSETVLVREGVLISEVSLREVPLYTTLDLLMSHKLALTISQCS